MRRQVLRRLVIIAALAFVIVLVAPSPVRAASSNAIEGYVCQYGTSCTPVQNVAVYWSPLTRCNVYGDLCSYGAWGSVMTDGTGHFLITSDSIDSAHAGWQYLIMVNGQDQIADSTVPDGFGKNLDNIAWTQWEGTVTLNSNGYASRNIYLSSTSSATVATAALFSHSAYATLQYNDGSANTFAHTVTFQVANTGISAAYMTQSQFSFQWKQYSGQSGYWGAPYVASSVWCDAAFSSYYQYCTKTGIQSTGVVTPWPNTGWSPHTISDFLGPNQLPTTNYINLPVPAQNAPSYTLTETQSTTWSQSYGGPLAISYSAFGTTINLNEVVTTQSSTTTSIQYTLDNTDPSGSSHTFRVYPVYNTAGTQGTPELHVWDCSSMPAVQNDANFGRDAADSFSGASNQPLIYSGTTYNGLLWSPCDTQDWYSFNVPGAPYTITITLTSPSNAAYDQELYNPNGAMLAGAYPQYNGAVSTITYPVCSGTSANWETREFIWPGQTGQGTYTLSVSVTSGASCGGGGGGGGSVMAGTRILMNDGTWVPVQNLAVGMSIRSFDPSAPSRFYDATITSIVTKSVNNLYVISTSSGNPIRVDYFENFWVQLPNGQQQWMHAGQLQLGYKILRPVDGVWTSITSIETDTGSYTVYDLVIQPTLPGGVMPDIANGYLIDKCPISCPN